MNDMSEEDVLRPKHEDCDLTCNIEEKIWESGFKATWCSSCFFIFKSEKINNQDAKKFENQKEREKTLDRSIVEASREEKSEKYKSEINIKEIYEARKIENSETKEWLTYKHYAKRVPLIVYAFGLFHKESKIMVGVVTYAPPARSLNMGYGCFGEENQVITYELNRLCVEDNLPKNTLSFFVSESLNLLKELHISLEVVSYADSNNNHHGYIYQATNWTYTGETQSVKVFIDTNTGKNVHARTLVSKYGSSSDESLPKNITWEYEKGGKFRYFKFLGNKKQIAKMNKDLKYEIKPYPKGKNERYDSSHNINQQLNLF
jgi:hypothetical protein